MTKRLCSFYVNYLECLCFMIELTPFCWGWTFEKFEDYARLWVGPLEVQIQWS